MKSILFPIIFLSIANIIIAQERGVTVSTPQGNNNDQVGEQYAFIVGVSKYPYIKPLNFADKDATLFRDFLRSKAGGGLKEENIVFMSNENANSGNFQAALSKFYRNPAYKKGDRAYFYFAGHGDCIKELNEYYLLLYDCQPAGDANNYQTGMSTIDMQKLKNRIGYMAKQGIEVFLILDACRSNELPGGYSSQVFSENIAEKKVGEIMMLATGPGQVSLESPNIGNGHGLFTYKLIDGLSGLADSEDGNNDGKTSLAELQDWVRRNVRVTAQKMNTQQVPVFCCSEKDNTIVTVVDSQFQKQWASAKTSNQKEMVFNYNKSLAVRNLGGLKADTLLVRLYNSFNESLQDYRLWGTNSADYFYSKIDSLFPASPLDTLAKDLLSKAFINICQQKINLYLDGKDNINDLAIAQKEMAATAKKFGFIKDRSMQLQAAYETNFAIAAKMLHKTIKMQSSDSALVDILSPKIYFFYLKDYYQQEDNNIEKQKQALIHCHKAWMADSNAAYISQAIALYYEKNKVYDSALFYLRNAIRLAPNWAYPKNHLGYVYYSQKSYDSAGKYFQEALQNNPLYMETYFNYGRLAAEKPTKDNPNPYYQKYIQLPNGVDAEVFEKYAKINPWPWNQSSSKWFFEKAANIYAAQRKYDRASYDFYCANNKAKAKYTAKQALVNHHGQLLAREILAATYKDENKHDSAILVLNQQIRQFPNHSDAILQLGHEYYLTNKKPSAINCFKKYITLEPNKPYGYQFIAHIYYESGKLDSALLYSKKGLVCEHKKLMFYINLANIYYDKNKKDSSKLYTDSAFIELENNKQSFVSLQDQVLDRFGLLENVWLGKIFDIKALNYFDQKMYDSTICYAKKGLQYDIPNTITGNLYSRIGDSYFNLNNYDSAISNYQNSIKVNPSLYQPYYNLACIYSIKNDTAQSLKYATEALNKGASIETMQNDTDLSNLTQSQAFKTFLKNRKKKIVSKKQITRTKH